jgi:outer membrane receptor protein involved in Fe transport
MRRALLALLLVHFFAGPLLAASGDHRETFKIAQGSSLIDALLMVAGKFQVSLSTNPPGFSGLKVACALNGPFTLRAALSRLLDPAGIKHDLSGNILQLSAPPRGHTTAGVNGGPGECAGSPVGHSLMAPLTLEDLTPPTVTDGISMPEVLVTTDTHLNSPVASNIDTLRRSDLDAAEFQTVGEAVRSLSQNFPGAQNPGVISTGGNQNLRSQSGASSANLHGLGISSTLVLLNGRPLATHETSAAVDMDQIPISAVDRIEVATGGASAIYGSDTVAGTVNVFLRSDLQGLEMSSVLGQAADGGGFQQRYILLNGKAWETGHLFADIDCQQQHPIDSNQRPYVPMEISGTTLWPSTRRCSILATATQEISDELSSSSVGFYTWRQNDTFENLDASSPGAAVATRSKIAQYDLASTLERKLGFDWVGLLTLGASADNVGNYETLHLDRHSQKNEGDRIDNRLDSIELGTHGSLARWSSGKVQLALGAGYDKSQLKFASNPDAPLTAAAPLALDLERRTRFVFAELNVALWPYSVVGDESGLHDVLSFSVAGRTSWYSVVGSTTNPRFSLRYNPTANFSAGASWGTAFRAPSPVQQYNPSRVTLRAVPNPTVPGDTLLALFEFGGNPQLRPEESEDFTLDFSYSPLWIPGLSLQATAYNINDRQRIGYPTTDTGNPLSDPNVGPFVQANPSAAQVNQALAQSQFVNMAGSSYSPYQAARIIDDRYQNVSREHARGVDLKIVYHCEVHLGDLETFVDTSYLDLGQQLSSVSSMLELSGTVFNPPRWRSRAGINWNDNHALAALWINYTGSSRNTAVTPAQPIGSWATMDATVSYLLVGQKSRSDVRLTLSVKNLWDRRPPYASVIQSGVPDVDYDATNATSIGRFVLLGVTKSWTR